MKWPRPRIMGAPSPAWIRSNNLPPPATVGEPPKVPTKCECGADVFDPPPKHTQACQAKHDLIRSFDDAFGAAFHVLLSPLDLGLRAWEWWTVRNQ